MLSLVELSRAAEALSDLLVGGRIERWVEPEKGRLAFSIYRRDESDARKLVVEIDARPGVGYIGVVGRMPKAPDSMPAFVAYLRAHLSRARLLSVKIRGEDRQLVLRFSAREGEYDLLFSIFGRRSNLYLLDADGTLLLALRPLADTRSELTPGSLWVDPASPPPHSGQDRFEGRGGVPLLEAIGSHYREELGERTADDDRKRLLAAIKRERKTVARRVERIARELEEAEMANTLQRHGELLKSHLSRIASGDTSITLDDFETGTPVEIPLDPKISPKANLDAIFKRYRKLLRRLSKAGGQIEGAREALRKIDALAEEVGAAESVDEILERDLAQRLLGRAASSQKEASGLAPPSKPKLPGVYRDLPRKLHPRRYRTSGGLEIWVGRSDEANDLLTTRLARGSDLFFHLDGAPGSHVILRTEGRPDPPSEAVLDACELAVHFSKQKNAGQADVHVAPIKLVKKPKGAKRGLVYVTGGKSVRLRREPARLERLLADRFED